MKKIRLRIEHLFMLIFAFFAALGHPLGRIIVREMHPIQLGTVTLLIGLVVLILYILFTGRLKSLFRIDKKDILLSAGIGVFGFFFFQIWMTFTRLFQALTKIK